DAETNSLFGAIVTLSMATTPFLMIATRRIRSGPKDARTREGPISDGASALIIGYGRFGQTVGQMLTLAGLKISLIDRNVDQIDTADEFGARVHYGDGLRMDVLRQAGAADASLLCFCIDGQQLTAEFLAAVREAYPDAAIMVRAFDRRSVMALAPQRYDFLVREVRESAIAMARAALDKVEITETEIDDLEERFRENDRQRLADQVAQNDLHAGDDRIIRAGWQATN
ncbi:MAG: NAD-binding protein, partial [Erythrobacter sp.]|nr:NAD-binding protein [Erythrobacter sp.]